MSESAPRVQAMALLGDRIVATGPLAELRERFPQAEPVDYGPATVVPGFNDAHQHLIDLSATLDQLDAGEERFTDARALLDGLAERCADTPPGRWVRAYRYDDTRGGGPGITRADLDRVSTRHPILVTQVSDHWGVLNSPALHLAGHPAEGDGIVAELELFRLAWSDEPVVELPSTAERVRGVEVLSRKYHAAGITSIGDALVSPEQLGLYAQVRRQGRLSLRVTALIDATYTDGFLDNGIGTGFGDEWLRVGGFKAFVDGAVAGRGCLLEEPFEGTEDHGIQVTPPEELAALFARVHRAGSVLAVHANGDRAIRQLLDVIETNRDGAPGPAQPHRIEHCSVLTEQALERISRAGLAAVPFGCFVAAHGPKLLDWYGAERLQRMFAHRWLLDEGIPVGGASDYSVSPYEPLLALQSMVTRESADGTVLGPAQRISAAEALWVYTVGSAMVAGEQRYKGRLAPGYLADYVVLGADPLTADPRELSTIPVRHTVIGGETVWSAPHE
ncbi:amidohydrolase [Sciscionella marina]|uniref:amidohydrolase n=1 Tax=Sciscionella marina TaxID=508770 RepID=UPI001F093396|nr:amidohydrolase [Sciscionella marina]